jgi:hypothetical protein
MKVVPLGVVRPHGGRRRRRANGGWRDRACTKKPATTTTTTKGLHGCRGRATRRHYRRRWYARRVEFFEHGGHAERSEDSGSEGEDEDTMAELEPPQGPPCSPLCVGELPQHRRHAAWLAHHFAARWTGRMIIRRGSWYHWQLISDDGSKMWVNTATRSTMTACTAGEAE